MHDHREAKTIDRRALVLGTAGAVATAGLAKAFVWPDVAGAHGSGVVTPPNPIPGGLEIGLPPPLDVIHVFAPGPTDVTLPFTHTTLQGLDVEPSTITDFNGMTALAFHTGSATGSDGASYNLETDIRAFEGEYVAADGSHQSGAFALI